MNNPCHPLFSFPFLVQNVPSFSFLYSVMIHLSWLSAHSPFSFKHAWTQYEDKIKTKVFHHSFSSSSFFSCSAHLSAKIVDKLFCTYSFPFVPSVSSETDYYQPNIQVTSNIASLELGDMNDLRENREEWLLTWSSQAIINTSVALI